jgi:hypothetical protein
VFNNNLNQYDANMTARYLLEHPEMDPNWEAHVRGILSWVESKFGQTAYGALAITEQTPVFPYLIGSHTSRYASINAMLYEKTGDLAAKEKAYRSFNWASYMARSNGVVIDGLLYNCECNANQWFSDGYGDYIRHFMTGLGAIPEWSPANQTHMVRSSSVVKSITYGVNTISYTTFDSTSTEVIHLNFNPVSVTADGVALQQRSDLTQPGWTLDVATKTIRIYHKAATQIVVNGGTSSRSANTKPVNMVPGGTDTTATTKAPVAVATTGEEQTIASTSMKIAPNPATNNFAIRYSTPSAGTAVITVTDAEGHTVAKINQAVARGQNTINVTPAAFWKSGIYLVTVVQGKWIERGKVMFQGQ